jgi:hypothetical protein
LQTFLSTPTDLDVALQGAYREGFCRASSRLDVGSLLNVM